MSTFVRAYVPLMLSTRTVVIDKSHRKYRICYTCDPDTPVTVELIIKEHADPDSKMLKEFTDYYNISVNNKLAKKYGRQFNVHLAHISDIY